MCQHVVAETMDRAQKPDPLPRSESPNEPEFAIVRDVPIGGLTLSPAGGDVVSPKSI
jgi:hypothetical protein